MRAGPRGPSADGIRPSRTLVGRQTRDLHDRPDVDGAQPCPWKPCGDINRLVEILDADRELVQLGANSLPVYAATGYATNGRPA
jgi:hypothetical protein